jgi:hypothetical protein
LAVDSSWVTHITSTTRATRDARGGRVLVFAVVTFSVDGVVSDTTVASALTASAISGVLFVVFSSGSIDAYEADPQYHNSQDGDQQEPTRGGSTLCPTERMVAG